MIGTPFELNDEVHNRKIQTLDNNKPAHQQEARDEQGRKHFYGAFSGALNERSVGYKGTVGSKEGFTPQTFVSSRAKRQKIDTNADVTIFMDEEDKKELKTSTQASNIKLVHENIDLMEVLGFKDQGTFSKIGQ